jgi:hypothetical protein
LTGQQWLNIYANHHDIISLDILLGMRQKEEMASSRRRKIAWANDRQGARINDVMGDLETLFATILK